MVQGANIGPNVVASATFVGVVAVLFFPAPVVFAIATAILVNVPVVVLNARRLVRNPNGRRVEVPLRALDVSKDGVVLAAKVFSRSPPYLYDQMISLRNLFAPKTSSNITRR